MGRGVKHPGRGGTIDTRGPGARLPRRRLRVLARWFLVAAVAGAAVVAGPLATGPAAAEDGLPPVVAGPAVGGVVPVDKAVPVEVSRLVLSVNVEAEEATLSLLPARVTATVEARYTLRLAGEADRPRAVSLRFLAPPEVDARWDGRPAELYPGVYPGEQPGQPAGTGTEPGPGTRAPWPPAGAGLWLDPLAGGFYPVPSPPAALVASQALGTDVTLRPGQSHELLLRFPRVALGWETSRYLSPVYQLEVPLSPEAWAAFGPVDVHVAVPPGYVAGVAASGPDQGGPQPASTGQGLQDDAGRAGSRPGAYGYHRWETAPPRVVVATTATTGMWGRVVTRRRDVLWLLVVTWTVFALARAGLWRIGRRPDGWAWAALPALLVLPLAAGWVSWHSLRVPLWGYPFSLLQYALWVGGGLYVAGRLLGDLGGFLWLRWLYRRSRRRAREFPAGEGPAGPAGTAGLQEPSEPSPEGARPVPRGSGPGGLTAPAGGS
ncbi:hypothetical protein [Thermaerobacter subterraneus]|uniref:Uncharacterized protein n=1 Tax=Thermaerobacter subterraneus DSM 13965 TaxID=867903 RepID=K6Q0X9_9FIRM|nr:hypothetical protein [Thermaerobacter subterraneus]EKP94793.1 hypothetical protein ThesuDRAFT_00498 [Thermaerobacter subterraneus DSM 13965]